MLDFSSFERNNVLHRRGWYAVWCYLPNTRQRTVYHSQGSHSVRDWTRGLARSPAEPGQEWAVLNGGYFGYDARLLRRSKRLRQPLIGSVGNGSAGAWSHGSPPGNTRRQFQRWAFGMQGEGAQRSTFQIGRMQPRRGRPGFWVPPAIENAFPYGFSGLLCLLKNGEPKVWQNGAHGAIRLEPAGQWGGSGEFVHGYYRRAAVGWTDDGRHLFLVVEHFPSDIIATRDLFGVYEGKKFKQAGALLDTFKAEFARLKPEERPCSPAELPRRIDNAMLLDGGHSASVMYRSYLGKGRPTAWEERGSWLTGPAWTLEAPVVPTMIEVTER